MKSTLLCCSAFFCPWLAVAQVDTLKVNDLDQVVITATKSERNLENMPIPVTVIAQKQVKQMGSLRLNDVLAEQTGLVLVYDHGTGIQMQGFSPEYTLILLDGEPIIGRTAGTLDLDRMAVGAIKQIEIVKGPSSSLYGSEALAGVINIITENSLKSGGSLSARYGTFNTVNLSTDLHLKRERFGVNLFANRYSSDGYDLTPEKLGQTVSPFQTYTFMPRFWVQLSDKTKLKLSSRFFTEGQTDKSLLVQDDRSEVLKSKGELTDFNINPVLIHQFSKQVSLTTRYYFSKYSTKSLRTFEQNKAVFDKSFFDQTFSRPEIQADIAFSDKSLLLAGLGLINESVKATRYNEQKRFSTTYAFIQYEHFFSDKLHLMAGGRFDAHSVYHNQFSPKISGLYSINKNLKLRASYGYGYKAPDFRQLYLNFTNAVAGYSVFGSEEVQAGIATLEKEGQLKSVLVDVSQFGVIRPESSRALNIGTTSTLPADVQLSVNLFRNDVKDLIESFSVAAKTNGQFVYSYRNVKAAFTQGAELNLAKKISLWKGQSLELSSGYQFLEAKDKTALQEVKAGKVFRRIAETQETERVDRKSYGGLFGRSKHNANLKIFYTNKNGFDANCRLVYRSRFGISDKNGNAVLDADNEYAKGFPMVNLAAAKAWKNWYFQAGADNVFDYTDAKTQPGLGGRRFFANVEFRF